MSTTAEKLTYLNTTKTLIKDNLNLGGANISNEPFRVYSSKLIDIYKDFLANGTDTLWNNWNKVNGTGESLTLNNTIQAKMKIDLKGNTSQEGTPTPDSPQDIHTITGNNKLLVENRNLWDELIEYGGYSGSTGQKVNTNYYRSTNYIPISANTELCFMKPIGKYTRIYFYDSSKAFISAPDVIYTNRLVSTFTTPENAKYMTFQIDYGSATYNNDICINISDSDNGTYTMHQEQTYPINLGSMELCKIGDYQDSIVKDNGKWYLNKQIGKVVLDGSESWREFFSTQGIFVFNPTISSLGTDNTNNGLSNYFENTTRATIRNNLATIDNKFSIYAKELVIAYKTITSVADFKTWLSTHNTIVYYVLATPTYTEITDSTLISQLEAIKLSYNEQTNISQENNDKPFILDVTALGELEI